MRQWDLGGGLVMREAEYAQFARLHAFYRPDPWLRDSRAARMDAFCEGTPCRLIEKDGQIAGGCLAGDGVLGEFFTVPPYSDRALLLRRTAAMIRRESQGRIWAYNVLASEVDDYHRIGFRLASRIASIEPEMMDYSYQFSRMMVRPAQEMEETLCAANLTTPKSADTDAIGLVLAQAYGSGDPARPEGDDFYKDARAFFKRPNDACRKASTLAWLDGEAVGACLISRWEGAPLISDIAVLPSSRNAGIARAMIARALTHLHRAGETQLRLFLECGNPAETLYHSMGFMAGEATTSMYMD